MLMVLLLLVGACLTIEGIGLAVGRGGSHARAMLGGALLMAAACVLPKAVFWIAFILAVAVAWVIYSAAKYGDRSKLTSLGMLAIGMTIVAAVQIAWIAAFNDFARFWFCIVSAHAPLAGALWKNYPVFRWAMGEALSGWPMAPVLLALIGAAALATQKGEGAIFRKLLLAALAAGGLLLVIMGTGPWLQYDFLLLAAVSGLAGMGLAWSCERFSPRARQCLAAAVLAMAVVWLWTNSPPNTDEQGTSALKQTLTPFQYMLDHAQPGDTCVILINANPVLMMDADPQQFGPVRCTQNLDDLRNAVSTVAVKRPRWIISVDTLTSEAREIPYCSLWLPKVGFQRIQLVRRPDGSVWLGTPALGYVPADDLVRRYEPNNMILLERRNEPLN